MIKLGEIVSQFQPRGWGPARTLFQGETIHENEKYVQIANQTAKTRTERTVTQVSCWKRIDPCSALFNHQVLPQRGHSLQRVPILPKYAVN